MLWTDSHMQGETFEVPFAESVSHYFKGRISLCHSVCSSGYFEVTFQDLRQLNGHNILSLTSSIVGRDIFAILQLY